MAKSRHDERPKPVQGIQIIAYEFKQWNKGYGLQAEIDLTEHIDYHDYHDAPSSVTIYLSLEDLDALKLQIEAARQKIGEIENVGHEPPSV